MLGWVFFLQTNFDFLTSHFWRIFLNIIRKVLLFIPFTVRSSLEFVIVVRSSLEINLTDVCRGEKRELSSHHSFAKSHHGFAKSHHLIMVSHNSGSPQ